MFGPPTVQLQIATETEPGSESAVGVPVSFPSLNYASLLEQRRAGQSPFLWVAVPTCREANRRRLQLASTEIRKRHGDEDVVLQLLAQLEGATEEKREVVHTFSSLARSWRKGQLARRIEALAN
jgi:hypothetical protein